MKSKRTQLIQKAGMTGLFALSVLAAGGAIAQQGDPPVFVRTEGLSPALAAKLIDKGAEGSAALVQYLHRTRMIHQLYVFDLVKSDDSKLAAQQPGADKVAKLDAAQ